MSGKSYAILTDVTQCIGCEECVKACQEYNELPPERPWRWLSSITDLSSSRWTTITREEGSQSDRFVKKQCRHCLEPACAEACIVGALKKTPEGPVIYDTEICIGCRYCMVACPWEIPRYSWEDTVPYIQKCDMCYERVKGKGRQPACVEACPTHATIFGDRDELLAEAHKRIREHPDRYIQHVWGENEVGGTSVMYISDVDIKLVDLAAPITDSTPVPERTFQVMEKMPGVFFGMASVMGGVWWIIDRRQKLMGRSEQDHQQDNQDNKEQGS